MARKRPSAVLALSARPGTGEPEASHSERPESFAFRALAAGPASRRSPCCCYFRLSKYVCGCWELRDVSRVGGREITARLQPDSALKAGQRGRFAIDLSKLVWFDPASGARVA